MIISSLATFITAAHKKNANTKLGLLKQLANSALLQEVKIDRLVRV